MDRRRFLGRALGAGGAAALGGAWAALLDGGCAGTSGVPASRALPAPEGRKLIIVQFGGGTHSSEAIDDPAHRFIPRLWNEMAPRGTLFTNMRVEGKVVHPNSTGSIMTGHWEYDDIDWSKPVAHPTVFEICRRARGAPDTSAWAFVYASILAKTAESTAAGYGREFAANVVEPPTIPRSTAEEVSRLMAHAAASGSLQMELDASAEAARLARSTSRIARGGLRSEAARAFLDREYASWRAGGGTTSHDAFLTDCALACMREFAPDVTAIGYGEIDCAHYGSWSRYVDAIRRTDELTWRVFRAAEELPAYRGRTLLLVLPDHGRELDRPGRWGFIHHSDFYTNEGADESCRRVWMLALGPGVAAGRTIDDAAPITAAASTGLEFLGLSTSSGSAGSVLGLAG
jgi:hypothetical protein